MKALFVSCPHRPNALNIRTALVIDDDVTLGIGIDPGGLEAEVVRVGPAPDGNQQMTSRNSLDAAVAVGFQPLFGTILLRRKTLGIEMDVDSLGGENLNYGL